MSDMIHPETFIVTADNGPRPAGKPDECFYCQRPIGAEHEADCVMRDRTVVVRLTVEYPIRVPEHWTPEDIELHRNDSSWCIGNAVVELDSVNDQGCICGIAKVEYVREATEDDEIRLPPREP
jgi:hypothetical protein